MEKADKIATIFFVVCTVFALTAWARWVSERDQHILNIADCMTIVQHNQHVSPQEAFLFCEKGE